MFNFSSLFGGSDTNGLGSINFSDYSMIKSGSYRRLMKSYYSDKKNTKSSTSTKNSRSILEKLEEEKRQQLQNTAKPKDTSGFSKMKSQADSLKSAAEVFTKSDLFKQSNGEYNTEKAAQAVTDFVNRYNSVIEQSGTTTSKDITQQINYMKRMTNTVSSSLSKVGITVGSDGKLSVNEETLKNADTSEMKGLFAGSHSYAADIAGKAGELANAAVRGSGVYNANGKMSGSSSSSFSDWI